MDRRQDSNRQLSAHGNFPTVANRKADQMATPKAFDSAPQIRIDFKVVHAVPRELVQQLDIIKYQFVHNSASALTWPKFENWGLRETDHSQVFTSSVQGKSNRKITVVA
jgi:hypothetical protein